ncbi:MAG: T9SS type A sorting domain-containing protein [Dysgonamonadaceae bacterium]|jgi:glycerophosphoryl diester phosphodiesterase|nr:T9SS type A sorting domain-containing protein [Dysgonamonadaceae bacterium]
MKRLILEKRIKFLVILLLAGMSAFAQDDIDDLDNFNSYEVEGKLSLAKIFAPQADLSGGIIGTIGVDDFDDNNNFFDPMIDIVVLDKKTNTIIYEIYLDSTSTTEKSKYWEYYAPELGESAIFYPYKWNSNDIKLSAIGINKFHQREFDDNQPYPFIKDSIDVIVRIFEYNAKLSQLKIPGMETIGGYSIPNSGSLSLLSELGDWLSERNCSKNSEKNKCPCMVWNKMRSPDTTKEADLIIAAHRGIWGGELGDGAPENSKRAIKNVKQEGLNLVEMDVMASKEGFIVLSHDYILQRLSNYGGGETYVFNQNYVKPTLFKAWDWLCYLVHATVIKDMLGTSPPDDMESATLKKRNGSISNDKQDKYLLFIEALHILKKNDLVALIDIKELMKNNADNVNSAYDLQTVAGQQKMKESWLNICKECFMIASREGLLDYIAFKTPYTYEEVTGNKGLSKSQAKYVRFMPMIQRPFTINPPNQPNINLGWDLNRALALVDSWASKLPDNVIAIETNFNLLTDVYLQTINHKGQSYVNLLHYVSSKGFRPGIFSEDPTGARGVADRWGKWHLPDSNTKNVRGNHLTLMSVPYFNTAVITSDRPDIWKQISNNYSTLRSSETDEYEELRLTNVDNPELAENTKININYLSDFIFINGLNKNDIGSDIMLYNLQGGLIYKDKIQSEPQMVLSQNLQLGVYLLKISGNRQASIKLIINK